MNNRILIIILAGLTALLLFSKLFRSNRTSSFDPDLVVVDTAKVDRLVFKAGGEEVESFEIRRTPDGWEAARGEMKVAVAAAQMENILASLSHLTAQRMITRDAARYADFEITEDQASSLTIFTGKKQAADLRLGGFKFDQVARTAATYVRLAGKPEVYLIDGFSTLGLKARFDQFRDKKLITLPAENITSIEWSDAPGRKEVVQKEDGVWHYAGMEAVDSSAFARYLDGIVNAQGSDFSDITSAEGLRLIEKLTLYGVQMTEPALIHAYAATDTVYPFLIQSSMNPGSFFKTDSVGLYKRLFSDFRSFWPDGQ